MAGHSRSNNGVASLGAKDVDARLRGHDGVICRYGTGSRIGSARIERWRPPRDAAVVSGHPSDG